MSQRQRRGKIKGHRRSPGFVLVVLTTLGQFLVGVCDCEPFFINDKLNAHGVTLLFDCLPFKCNRVVHRVFMSSSTLCNVIISLTVVKVDEWMGGLFDRDENMMSLLIIVIINLLSMRKITCLMFEPCAKSKNDTRKKDCISVALVELKYKNSL